MYIGTNIYAYTTNTSDLEAFFSGTPVSHTHTGQDLSETLTRAKFEELCLDLFKSTIKPVKKVLTDSGLEKSQIDQVPFIQYIYIT